MKNRKKKRTLAEGKLPSNELVAFLCSLAVEPAILRYLWIPANGSSRVPLEWYTLNATRRVRSPLVSICATCFLKFENVCSMLHLDNLHPC